MYSGLSAGNFCNSSPTVAGAWPERALECRARLGQPPRVAHGEPRGTTSGGARGYEGMCPPDGMHTYRFAVFAFASPVQVDTRTAWTIDAFEKSYRAQAIGKAQITGTFQ